jgi:hypothetical protein
VGKNRQHSGAAPTGQSGQSARVVEVTVAEDDRKHAGQVDT